MTRLPLNALQKAAYVRLAADMAPTLVFDDGAVPEATPFPYITIGIPTVSRSSLKGHGLVSATLMFHAFSIGLGKKEANDLLDKIVNSLSRAPLPLTDAFEDSTAGLWELSDIIPEEHEVEGVVQHGSLRYRWEILDTNQS